MNLELSSTNCDNISGNQCQNTQNEKKRKRQYTKKSSNPKEAKNIPKLFGVLIKEHFNKHYKQLKKQNYRIKKFINNFKQKSNSCTRYELKELFSDEQANKIIKAYICSFELISDILNSKKLIHLFTLLKYIKKIFCCICVPNQLKSLKLQDSIYNFSN